MGAGQSTLDYEQKLIADTTQYAYEVPNSATADSSAIRRHPSAKDALLTASFTNEPNGGVKTIWDAFQRPVTKTPKANFLGTRRYDGENRTEYIWDSYEEIDVISRDIGSGLVALGAQSQDHIGIFSNNRAEWVATQQGIYSQSMVVISLYATLGAEAIEYIVNHAGTKIVFISKENMKGFLKVLPKVKETTHTIVQFDVNAKYGNAAEVVSDDDRLAAEKHGIKLIGLSELIALGKEKNNFPNLPTADSLAFIMYTSGTTGNPKGVLLTHGNIVSSAGTVEYIIPLKQEDVYFSFLPLAHIFETVVEVAVYMNCGSVGFFQGNVKKLQDDLLALRPSVFAGVPRIYSRFYQKIFEGVNNGSCVIRWFFNRAYAYQCQMLRTGGQMDPGYDAKVFSSVRAKLGLNNCRIMISGAAPCPPYLIEFLKVLMGTKGVFCQGYGMTETSAASAISPAADNNIGHVGAPLPNNEFKLVDVKDMEYHATDKPCPRGEIWIRGPNIFKGYFKDEAATASTITADGWCQTGDIGRFNPNGTVSIIDRKKNMFKLSQGEYVAAEKIESEYSQSPLVGQIWVYGNGFHNVLLAVVVPAAEPLYNKFLENGWWPSPKESTVIASEQFCADFNKVCTEHAAEVKKMVVESLKLQEKSLKGFEKVVDILIESNIDKMLSGFNEANGCLTPTFKLKRNQLLKKYVQPLKELYNKNDDPCKAGEKWPGEE